MAGIEKKRKSFSAHKDEKEEFSFLGIDRNLNKQGKLCGILFIRVEKQKPNCYLRRKNGSKGYASVS
jgi:hypothetical protein